MNSNYGVISGTKRCCTAPLSKVEHQILDRRCAALWCSVNSYLHHIKGESGPGCSKPGKDNPLLESALNNNKKETQVKI